MSQFHISRKGPGPNVAIMSMRKSAGKFTHTHRSPMLILLTVRLPGASGGSEIWEGSVQQSCIDIYSKIGRGRPFEDDRVANAELQKAMDTFNGEKRRFDPYQTNNSITFFTWSTYNGSSIHALPMKCGICITR